MAHAVMNATQPRLQVGEDEMNDRQILLSDLGVASLGDGEVFVAALGEAGIAGPIVGDDRRTRSNGALDKAAERFRAAVWHDSESDTSGVATALPLIELGSRLALSHFNGAGDKKLVVNVPIRLSPTPTICMAWRRVAREGASFGRFGGWRRRYPGGSECRSIFLTVSRAMPNRLAASRWLRPSTWQASRTRRYRSTVYILPPSISKKIEGYRWQSFTPPAAGKSRRFRGLICHRRSQIRPFISRPGENLAREMVRQVVVSNQADVDISGSEFDFVRSIRVFHIQYTRIVGRDRECTEYDQTTLGTYGAQGDFGWATSHYGNVPSWYPKRTGFCGLSTDRAVAIEWQDYEGNLGHEFVRY